MPIGEPFIQLIAVDSTNNYAMRQVQAHLAEHGTAWFAHEQNAGKGQRNKTWISEPKQNIILSIAVDPKPLIIREQFVLSAAVALACHDFFSNYAVSDVKIKWPNDLYWKDRKAGGILIENILKGTEWRFAIAGIGLNINQASFPGHLTNAVSLRQVTGKTFDVANLAIVLCECLEIRWQQVQNRKYKDVIEDYSRQLYKINQEVTFRKNDAEFTATVIGVNEYGDLLLSTENGNTISFSQIEWVLSK